MDKTDIEIDRLLKSKFEMLLAKCEVNESFNVDDMQTIRFILECVVDSYNKREKVESENKLNY